VHWSAEAVATEVNDEVVLLNLVRDRCYGLRKERDQAQAA
jgi:hypothetical protein